jgi:methionyl-tRNA formyltransferase
MRILFAGTPAIAVPSLNTLAEMELEGNGLVLAGILTNPDSRRGRAQGQTEPTDISAAALALDLIRKEKGLPPIPQLKPEKLDKAAREAVAALNPDILVSFAYGRIFGPLFLALFPMGGINIHPSLLPKYRGASPIPAAIFAGEKETGICIQKLALEMDSGDILTSEYIPLSGQETTASLSAAVSQKAAFLLRSLFSNFDIMAQNPRPQEGEIVYCREIKKDDGLINWGKSALQIDAQIRAYTAWPLSFTFRGKEKLFILEARALEQYDKTQMPAPPGTVLGPGADGILIQTGQGILSVTKLQWQAKNPLTWKAFCNGARNFIGAELGSQFD